MALINDSFDLESATKPTIDWPRFKKDVEEIVDEKLKKQEVCPNCGRCPVCGEPMNKEYYPWVPAPNPLGPLPYYTMNPLQYYTITCSDTS